MNDDLPGPGDPCAAALAVLYAVSGHLAAALRVTSSKMESLLHQAGLARHDPEVTYLVAALQALSAAGLDPEVLVALRHLRETGTPVDDRLALLALGAGASPGEACHWAANGAWPDEDTLRGLCALRGHESVAVPSDAARPEPIA